MSAPLLRLAWRESRTARRRLLIYMSSISFGVGALVAIDSFSSNVTGSVREQSRALMGGDLSISSREKFTPAADSILAAQVSKRHVEIARQTNFPSMVVYSPVVSTRLVDVRAVTPNYPLYGAITTDPASAWASLDSGRTMVVDRGLLVTLGASVGDSLSLGSARFRVAGVLASVPGDLGIAATIGPRVYIAMRNLAATGLLVFGSRASYEAVVKLPASVNADGLVREISPSLRTAGVTRVQSAGRNEQRLSDTIEQLSDFLALVGLVALLLGGIGVASGVHAFVMRKIDTVAVLRCVGATSGQVLTIYVTQAAVMGLVGASIGAAAGVAVQMLLPRLITEFLPIDVSVSFVPSAAAVGLAIGVWVALIFALRPLVAVRGISPLQALRRDTDAEVLRKARFDSMHVVINIAIVGSLVTLGLARAQTAQRGIAYSTAIAIAIGVLWVVAAALVGSARRAATPALPFPVRQGIAALYRPGNQTRAVVLALGFGVFLIGTLYQVQRNLLQSLNVRLDQSRANVVFFDVQEPMLPGVDSLIRAAGHTIVETTPIVRMRVASINGVAVRRPGSGPDSSRDSSAREGRPRGWAGGREYNSTFRDSLTSAEKLTSGRWFTATHPAGVLPEISMEGSVAQSLRVKLGDTVTWNVQGVDVPTRLTSLREVQWANFQTNFFVVFSPDALIHAPKQFVVLVDAHDPLSIARLQGKVVQRYPTISSIDLTLVRKTITDVIGKVTTAIRFLAILSLGLAIPVLFSAVSATRRQRLREGVLLKTLGATRRQIGRIMLSEYAVLGGLGALAGVVLSTAGAWGLMHWVFRMAFIPAVLPMIGVGLAIMLLSVSIGLLTGREVFAETPMAALREV